MEKRVFSVVFEVHHTVYKQPIIEILAPIILIKVLKGF